MLDKILGTGWKTVTGAIAWALGHTGLITTLLGLAGVHVANLDGILQSIGAAVAAVGVAHKINRFDLSALINTLVTAVQDYQGRTAPPAAPGS